MPLQSQQIAINPDHLNPKQRELEKQIEEEKKRWRWFNGFCVNSEYFTKDQQNNTP